jgi:hypothetical protein
VIDAFGFGGTTGYYNDNLGAFNVNITLSGVMTAVPEPTDLALMVAGLAFLGAVCRRRTRSH